MLRQVAAGITLAMILLIGNSGAFAAKPWDLIISTKFEQTQIEITEKPVLVGVITDQKGEPVFGAKVNIRFANESVTTTTDEDGNFRYEFNTQDHEGMFAASISASVADLKGLSKATLKIGSGVSTFGDLYYDKNFDVNLKNDTYKTLKQKQYQKFVEEQNKRKQKQYDIEAKKIAMQEKRSVVDQKRNDAINTTKPGSGVYSYEDQERYISKLNPKIKDTVKAQMEYTRQIYEEAKYEMKKVLDGGGSLEDAKKAYFDKMASTHDQIQKIGGENNTGNHSKIKKSQDVKINSKKVKGLTYNKYFK